MTGLSWQSLRTRLVAGALCAAVASIWIVTLVIGQYLRADMEAAISAQQHSTVSLIASEIDRSLNERNKILGELARRLGDAGELDGRAAQALLESQSGLGPMFNWGVIVLDADGVAVSSVQGKHNRVGGRSLSWPSSPRMTRATCGTSASTRKSTRTGSSPGHRAPGSGARAAPTAASTC